MADEMKRRLHRIMTTAFAAVVALATRGGRALNNIVSFGEDARGEMYILDQDGEVYRIVPAGS